MTPAKATEGPETFTDRDGKKWLIVDRGTKAPETGFTWEYSADVEVGDIALQLRPIPEETEGEHHAKNLDEVERWMNLATTAMSPMGSIVVGNAAAYIRKLEAERKKA